MVGINDFGGNLDPLNYPSLPAWAAAVAAALDNSDTSVDDRIAYLEAATKQYVDTAVAGVGGGAEIKIFETIDQVSNISSITCTHNWNLSYVDFHRRVNFRMYRKWYSGYSAGNHTIDVTSQAKILWASANACTWTFTTNATAGYHYILVLQLNPVPTSIITALGSAGGPP